MGELKQKVVTGMTVKVDKEVLYKLRMKYQRAKVTDITALNMALETQLTAIVNKDAKPDQVQLDIMGEMLDFVIENIEREEEEKAAMERTSEEWRRMEYEYQRVADGYYSMFTIEALSEKDEYYNVKNYRECSHIFCINAFKPKRKNQTYCSDACRKKEHEAQQEYKRTSKIYANGTYLPKSAYLTNRDKTEQEKYMEHERLFDEETLQMVYNDSDDEYDPTAKAANRERRTRSASIDNATEAGKNKHGEVITYKLSEMTPKEIEKTFGDSFIKRINPSAFSR